MKLDSKVKGGLAWAGLIVILAVPAADILFGQSGANSEATAATAATTASVAKPTLTLPTAKPAPGTDPVQTASVDGVDPVDKFLESGKKLPSYISDGDAVASRPAPVSVKPVAPVTVPTDVATVAPTGVEPPVPLPRSARPQTTTVAALPPEEKPLIVDETRLNNQAAREPFPLSDEGDIVSGDELEEWDSGSLADYLERKGLLSGGSTQAVQEDEFYVDQPQQRRRLDEFYLF